MGPLTATESAARDCMIDAADQAWDMGGWMRRPPFAYNDAWPHPVDENLNFTIDQKDGQKNHLMQHSAPPQKVHCSCDINATN